MKFAEIFWLLAIVVLVPACLLLLSWSARRKRASLDRVVAPRLHEQLLRSVDYTKRRLKAVLLVAALVLLIVALARPLLGFREIKIEKPGVDVIIALDISRSMLAEDSFWKEAKTNRLAAAKLGIDRMIDRLTGDRVGLMIFAGEPFLMAPVTTDHNSIQRTLTAVNTTAISKPGSDIAAAIKMALKSFEEKQEFGKAIVILTDGEELQGDAITAAREASAKGVAIFTVGVGSTTGAKLPDRSQYQPRVPNNRFGPNGAKPPAAAPATPKFLKNEFGTEVVSRLNERVLQQIAVSGRGFYAALGQEGEGLLDVSDRGLRPLAKGTQTRQSKDREEYFQIPLAICLAFFFWELLVNERRKV